jgi:hypothetical protein
VLPQSPLTVGHSTEAGALQFSLPLLMTRTLAEPAIAPTTTPARIHVPVLATIGLFPISRFMVDGTSGCQ